MTDAAPSPPFLVVPGWGGSGIDHWQTLWTFELGAKRIELSDWLDPRRESWTGALDHAVYQLAHRDPRPPIVIAHSLGCIAVAAWAQTARRAIRAALLVAPADVERAASLHQLREFQPLPRRALPFRSLVVASDDDPYLTIDRARELSLTWGSDLHVVSSGGHLNAASGLGGWPHGRALLSALVRATSLARAG